MTKYEEMFEFRVCGLSYTDIERAIGEHYGFGLGSSSDFVELPPTKEGRSGDCAISIEFVNGALFQGRATYYKNVKESGYVVRMSSIIISKPKNKEH